jgi:hypothetical protein
LETVEVVAKLMEIDRSLGKLDIPAIRRMPLAAQDGVIQIERAFIATLGEDGRLKELLEPCERFARRVFQLAESETEYRKR